MIARALTVTRWARRLLARSERVLELAEAALRDARETQPRRHCIACQEPTRLSTSHGTYCAACIDFIHGASA